MRQLNVGGYGQFIRLYIMAGCQRGDSRDSNRVIEIGTRQDFISFNGLKRFIELRFLTRCSSSISVRMGTVLYKVVASQAVLGSSPNARCTRGVFGDVPLIGCPML